MLRTRRLIFALCSISIVASAQGDPLAWFPLHTGTRWVYQHEWKSGNRNQPNVERWTSEEAIAGWVTVPEGLVVLREVREQGSSTLQPVRTKIIAPNGQRRELELPGTPHPASRVTRDREPYLVRGNCVYVIGDGWDPQNQRLRPSYQRYLAEDALSADFCFPLQTGSRWGNNDVAWSVEPGSAQEGLFLPAEYANAIHIFSSHFGSGGRDDVWFEKGVGVVGEHYIHNGTYDEYTKKLLSFSP